MAGNEELFQKAMNQGHSAAWDGTWDQAAFFYRQALEQFPDNPKALTSLGLALSEQQQLEEALTCYRRAAVITPQDPLPIEKVAQLCERMGRLNDATRASLQAAELYVKNQEVDKAIENWTRVTRFSPDHLTAHSRLAMIYERQGRKAEAVSEYLAVAYLVQHAGDMVKAAQAVNYAFMIMPESGEARQALTMLKANQVLPRPARPRGGTGPVLMAKVRQLEGANSDEEESSSLDPIAEARQKSLVTLAGILFDQADEPTEGQSNRRGLIAITRSPGITPGEGGERSKMITHLSQAIDFQTQEREDVSAAELEKSIAAGLTQPAAFFNLGLLQFQREQYDPAIANLHSAVKHPDFALASRLLMGKALRKTGRLTEASVEYLESLRIADGTTVSAQQAGEMSQLYESLIESQSQETDKTICDNLCTNIASMLERPDWKQQLNRARQELPPQPEGSVPLPLAEMMLQTHGSQVIESLSSIRRMIEKNQIRTASEEAFFALMYAPSYLPIHIQIGELLLKEGQVQEAVQKFTLVAEVYNARGETGQSIQLLRRIMALNPMDLSVRSRLIDALMDQGKVDEAIHEDIDLAETYYRLTELDMARKTYMTALRLTQQSSSNRKWSTRILNRVADIDMQRMDWRQALRVFEQIRVLQPDDEKVRQNLIDINFRIGQESVGLTELDNFINFYEDKGQRSKAIQFLQTLINDRPEKLEFHRRMADLYQKNGQVDKAIAEMDMMGDLLISAGNKTGAMNIIQAILGLNPPNAADYQKLLRQLQNSK